MGILVGGKIRCHSGAGSTGFLVAFVVLRLGKTGASGTSASAAN